MPANTKGYLRSCRLWPGYPVVELCPACEVRVMENSIVGLEQTIRRRLRAIAWSDEIAADFQRLVENGLRRENDLRAMALGSSLDPTVRAAACWFLVRTVPKSVSEPVLLSLLAHSPPSVRAEAARSLGIVGSKKALPDLADLALHEPDILVRQSSVYALGLLGDERGLDSLLSIARNEQEPLDLRGLAVEQIGVLGISTPKVLQTLRSLIRHESTDVSFWSVYALGRLGDTSVVSDLAAVAESDDRTFEPFGTLRDEALGAIDLVRSRESFPGTQSKGQ